MKRIQATLVGLVLAIGLLVQFLYNDPRFIYWTHELNSVLQQLQQADPESLSFAHENLRMSVLVYPGTDPCTIFGNSLECLVHTDGSSHSGRSHWLSAGERHGY